MDTVWYPDDGFTVAGDTVLTTANMRNRIQAAGLPQPFTVICLSLRIVKQYCPTLFRGCLAEETSFTLMKEKSISRIDLLGLQILADIYGYSEEYLIPPDAFEELGYKIIRNMGCKAVCDFASFVARNNGNPGKICDIALNPCAEKSEAASQGCSEYLTQWFATLLAAGKMSIIGPMFRMGGVPGTVKVAGDALSYHLEPESWNYRMFIPNGGGIDLSDVDRARKIVHRYARAQRSFSNVATEKRYRCPFYYKVARNQHPGNYRGDSDRGYCDTMFSVDGLNQHLIDEHLAVENLFDDCVDCGQLWIIRGATACDEQCYLADPSINCFKANRVHFANRKKPSVNFPQGIRGVRLGLSATSLNVLHGWRNEYMRSGIKVYGSGNNFVLTFVVARA
ncbi:uncharacterized protein LOC129601544 [Paramacrobiotus metropolitanus]|uniref:uncharacterized protein LOC129601544 n=1 Tax=Paramacrobiotus metropolitanus TaxID=2943436 RepID=UPI002445A185|nr:uncharacterized protein LOC129601544 [Paramacrobiotus metropolitanus]